MKQAPVIFAILALGMIMIMGCVQQDSGPTTVPPTQQTLPPTVVTVETPTPQMTTVTPAVPEYKTAVLKDLLFGSGSNQQNGFVVDYPSSWTYGKERISWPARASPVKEISGSERIRYWRAVYNFSSPDKKLYARVYFDDVTGTGDYFYNLRTWADGVIREKTQRYCIDGAGSPLDLSYCSDARLFFNPVLVSNDPVAVNGSFEARRLVFTSYDDENYGRYTLYIMHSGTMQGYNFTIPDHPEVAVEVSGPAWDFGRGGQAYAVDFHTSLSQVNATSDTFSHMINSFEITG